MSTVTERVAAGAAFLDEMDPGWWRAGTENAIDLDALDLGDGARCVLGQRCPLENLTAWLGMTPQDADDYEYSYHAQAARLSGLPSTGYRDERETWAVSHGFNREYGLGEASYEDLTAEWKRVIEGRRAAA